MILLRSLSLMISVASLLGCDKKTLEPVTTSPSVDRLQGTWKEVNSVCSGTIYTASNITNTITFSGAQYTITNTSSNCVATRTGAFSAGEPSSLSLGYAALGCSPSSCKLLFKLNSDSKTTDCPTQVSTDGQSYAFSVDDTTLYMTPQTGPDKNCYYKYTRQP